MRGAGRWRSAGGQGSWSLHGPATRPPAGDHSAWPDRVAFQVGDGRTLAFVRKQVIGVSGSRLTLVGVDGRPSLLLLTAGTTFGTRRLPTTRAEVVPGAVVAALVEQLAEGEDLALRIVVAPVPGDDGPVRAPGVGGDLA